jgi:hypothetical protein
VYYFLHITAAMDDIPGSMIDCDGPAGVKANSCTLALQGRCLCRLSNA